MITNLLAALLSFVSLALSLLRLVQLRTPWGFLLLPAKVASSALAPLLGVVGLVGAVLGGIVRRRAIVIAGLLGAFLSARHTWRVVTSYGDFAGAFGPDFAQRVGPERSGGMLRRRWNWRLPRAAEPVWRRDLPFCILPGTNRTLLCDLWQPPPSVQPSGLAIVYLHGSSWYLLDKDFGTRTFFRRLAVQGHVIMDVAYRLCPETDLWGMVGDAKRAVAWIKTHASDLGIDPSHVVIGGASAGGQIALLTAYAPDHPRHTPEDVAGADLSTCAVFAYYPPADLQAMADYNASLRRASGPPIPGVLQAPARGGLQWWRFQALQMRRARNTFADLLGGPAVQNPELIALGSPLHQVTPHCPPTFLVHGAADLTVPVTATRALYRTLRAQGVPTVYLELPQVDHAFGASLLSVSPPAQVALFELERFLALAGRGTEEEKSHERETVQPDRARHRHGAGHGVREVSRGAHLL